MAKEGNHMLNHKTDRQHKTEAPIVEGTMDRLRQMQARLQARKEAGLIQAKKARIFDMTREEELQAKAARRTEKSVAKEIEDLMRDVEAFGERLDMASSVIRHGDFSDTGYLVQNGIVGGWCSMGL